MDILKNNKIQPDQWNELVTYSTTASYFQTKNCFDFYNTLNFAQGFVYAVKTEGKLKALVCGYIMADGGTVKQFFSKRAIIPAGVMIHPDCTTNELALLLRTTRKELKSKAIYTEMRNYFDYSAYKTVFEQNGFEYKAHLNFHVATPSVEIALKNLSSTKRRDVKLSLKEGASITNTKSQTDWDAYFELLNHLYSSKIKTPLFPKSFFDQLLHQSEAHLFAIHFNGELIGGSLCVELKERILYEWFVCGKDGQFKNIYPSTLATWAAIEYAAEQNHTYFDMMGAGKPDEGYGVREFKSKFGGELVEHGRFLSINNRLLYSLGKKAVEIIKKRK